VPLTASGSNGTFLSSIVNALRLASGAQANLRPRVLNYLRDKELLLVITNFDPVFGQAAVLEDILKRAPRVKIVVTSYKPLNLSTEWIYDV
jgi:hypothetical protein